jgi:hypothetical protein
MELDVVFEVDGRGLAQLDGRVRGDDLMVVVVLGGGGALRESTFAGSAVGSQCVCARGVRDAAALPFFTFSRANA